MPNRDDKNWMRLCAAINGFRSRYSRWPKRVRLHHSSLEEIRDLTLTLEDFAKITEKISLVRDDDAEFIAEDDHGGTFNYGREGSGHSEPDVPASDWLGVQPKHQEPQRVRNSLSAPTKSVFSSKVELESFSSQHQGKSLFTELGKVDDRPFAAEIYGLPYPPVQSRLWVRPNRNLDRTSVEGYALTFDGYAFAAALGFDMITLGGEVYRTGLARERLPETFLDLRCCLFWLQRCVRFGSDGNREIAELFNLNQFLGAHQE